MNRSRRTVAWFAAVLLCCGATGITPAPAEAAPTDAATSSKVTLTNAKNAINPDGAPYPDLEVTISQTKDMVSQGITISYKGGGKGSVTNNNGTGQRFLQIFQCWGEDPLHPGHPDRRTCQLGAADTRDALRAWTPVREDLIRDEDKPFTWSFTILVDERTFASEIPFVARTTANQVDHLKADPKNVLWNYAPKADGTLELKGETERNNKPDNAFFNRRSTNEISWAPFGEDGSGSVPMDVQTAVESPALGCGYVDPKATGTPTGAPCWLVVVPRGDTDEGGGPVSSSPLAWGNWEHALAVKMDFKPVGVRCQIGAAERQVAGSELVGNAMGSWQPELCQGKNGAPYVLTQIPETDAMQTAAQLEPSALAMNSLPLDIERMGWDRDPLAYAPLAIGGAAVAFSFDRIPGPDATDAQRSRDGLPMTQMKLTPRLVAKLLTASYSDAIPTGVEKLGEKRVRNIVFDQEFKKINDPEWSAQHQTGVGISDALLPQGRSDLARAMWDYVLADPEAKAFLEGKPDEYGMTVNPCYSIKPEISKQCPKQAPEDPDTPPLELPRDDFPKADPSEVPAKEGTGIDAYGAKNLVTWRPYVNSFADGGYHVLRADPMALGPWDPDPAKLQYTREPRQLIGRRATIGLTTTPAAWQFQTLTAALRNPAGEFVAPTNESLSAAASAMTPARAGSPVLRFDPTSAQAKAAKGAYPLAVPIYASINPEQTDADLRAGYADMIEYAVTKGQTPGTDPGLLPPGYAPIPQAWVTQAKTAAEIIRKGAWPQASTAPSATPAPSTSAAPTTSANTDASTDTDTTGDSGTGTSDTGSNSYPDNSSSTADGSVPQSSTNEQTSTNSTTGTSQVPPQQKTPPEKSTTGTQAVPPAGDGNFAVVKTPDDPSVGPMAGLVPAAGMVGLAALVGAPLLTRGRRLE